MSTAGIILAAGASRRLGRPKQDVLLGGMTLLERTVRVALEAELAPVIVVVRDASWLEKLSGFPVAVVVNPWADEGMAGSVRCGIGALGDTRTEGAVVLTCDQPLLRVEHLRALGRRPEQVTASAYAGHIGVPAYFPAENFPLLLTLRGDEGARALLRSAATVEDQELVLDVDTPEDLLQAEAALRRQAEWG